MDELQTTTTLVDKPREEVEKILISKWMEQLAKSEESLSKIIKDIDEATVHIENLLHSKNIKEGCFIDMDGVLFVVKKNHHNSRLLPVKIEPIW